MTALTRSPLDYETDNRIDLAQIARTAFDHKLLIGSITGLFTALGIVYAILATPVYEASGMIQIETKRSASPPSRRSSRGPIRSRRR